MSLAPTSISTSITITPQIIVVETTITLNLSPSIVEPNKTFTWSGKLRRTDGQNPSIQTIRLLINGTVTDSTICDSNGNFTATEGAPAADGSYSYKSYFGGATLGLERLEASISPQIMLWGK